MGAALAAGAHAPVALAASPLLSSNVANPFTGPAPLTAAPAAAPGGLPGVHGLERADQPDGRALRARRPGLRRREERAHQGLRRPRATRRRRLRRPPHRGPRLLGPGPARAWRSTRSSRPARTSTCCTRTTATRARRTTPRWRRRLPDAAGRRPTTAAWSAAGSRGCSDRQRDGDRAGADRGLVPAVPEPLDRRPRLRPRRRAVRQRRRRRELQLRRLRPGRQPASTPAATRPAARRRP